MSGHDENTSRVAIKLGEPPSTSSHGIKKRSRPTHVKRHRAHALDEESASESDEEREQPIRHELITTYGFDGSNHSAGSDEERKEQGHQAKRHKYDNRRGGRSHKHDAPADRHDKGREASPDAQDKPVKWGLTINMKSSSSRKDEKETKARGGRRRSQKEEPSTNGKPERNLDDEALDALIGTQASKKSKRDSGHTDDPDGEPRPEDYRAVPIDDFGATLLRSFGWDGQMRGKVKEVIKHANLTGLGAKDAKGAEDLGAWNQKTSRDSRPVRLEDYQREQSKKRQQLEDRHRDSYKGERERERGHHRER